MCSCPPKFFGLAGLPPPVTLPGDLFLVANSETFSPRTKKWLFLAKNSIFGPARQKLHIFLNPQRKKFDTSKSRTLRDPAARGLTVGSRVVPCGTFPELAVGLWVPLPIRALEGGGVVGTSVVYSTDKEKQASSLFLEIKFFIYLFIMCFRSAHGMSVYQQIERLRCAICEKITDH